MSVEIFYGYFIEQFLYKDLKNYEENICEKVLFYLSCSLLASFVTETALI